MAVDTGGMVFPPCCRIAGQLISNAEYAKQTLKLIFSERVMFSHVTIGTNRLVNATKFYKQIFAPLGITLLALKHNPERALFTHATGSGTAFCIYSPLNGEPATSGNGGMVAFEAQTRAQVDDFYAIAMANGATDEGAPGLRPQYASDYYGAYIRDLDGNKICCVCHHAC